MIGYDPHPSTPDLNDISLAKASCKPFLSSDSETSPILPHLYPKITPAPNATLTPTSAEFSKKRILESRENGIFRFDKYGYHQSKKAKLDKENDPSIQSDNIESGLLADLHGFTFCSEHLLSTAIFHTKCKDGKDRSVLKPKSRKKRVPLKSSTPEKLNVEEQKYESDPLECNETLEDYSLPRKQCYEVPNLVFENDISGTATPTRVNSQSSKLDETYLMKSLIDFSECASDNDFFEELEIVNSIADVKKSTKLLKLVKDEEIPLLELSLFSWVNNLEREEILASHRVPDCLSRNEISPMSRFIVLNWIRDVISEHKMSRQAFHASIMLLDIFLSTESFGEDSFQLVAVAALMVALKAHETQQFPISFLVEFMWDEESLTPAENAEQIEAAKKFLLKYEYKLMKTLQWDVYIPTPIDFLQMNFQNAALLCDELARHDLPELLYDSTKDSCAQSVMHQRYDTFRFAEAASLVDTAVMDYESMNFTSSILAASAFWRIIQNIDFENASLRRNLDECFKDDSSYNGDYREKLLKIATGYELNDLCGCLKYMEVYEPCDIASIINEESMVESIQKWSMEGRDFRLEEDQIMGTFSSEEYAAIVGQREDSHGQRTKLIYKPE